MKLTEIGTLLKVNGKSICVTLKSGVFEARLITISTSTEPNPNNKGAPMQAAINMNMTYIEIVDAAFF